jgi:hypothetical protein
MKTYIPVVGTGHIFAPNLAYLPIFFLILAPLSLLSYVAAFVTWILATLLGYITVVYAVVRRVPAIALVLASPFTAANLCWGQTAFLTASLFGASLLLLERQPILAGVFIGCLTYKPQFGILIPLALAAIRKWQALAGAVVTTAVLAGVSLAAFGTGIWEALPRGVVALAGQNLSADLDFIDPNFAPRNYWGYLQTVYGLTRALAGGATLAWGLQALATVGAAVIVWVVWRSPIRYSLKAATLSAAALIATPYAHAYDLALIAIPLAFLAQDQIHFGLIPGEQPLLLAVFGGSLVCNLGYLPLGPVVVTVLLGLILRRAFRHGWPSRHSEVRTPGSHGTSTRATGLLKHRHD